MVVSTQLNDDSGKNYLNVLQSMVRTSSPEEKKTITFDAFLSSITGTNKISI
jgi:hypothetical protein